MSTTATITGQTGDVAASSGALASTAPTGAAEAWMDRATVGVWGWVVFATLVLALVASTLAGLPAGSVPESHVWDLWVVAAATLLVQSLPIHITTAGGRHSVVLTEVVLAVGLFYVEPTSFVLGVLVGATPALIRIRSGPEKFAVNLLQSGLWAAIPMLAFHVVVDRVEPTAWVVAAAFGACLLAFFGATLSVRVPIGIATGQWWVDRTEARFLAASSVTALGAAALALVGVLLAAQSPALLLLLALPVAQLFLALLQQARAVDRRAALDFTVGAAQQLREAEDVPGVLTSLLPGLREAFAVEQVLLLLDVPGHEVAATVTAAGSGPSVAVGDPLRRWLGLRGQDGPSTMRKDPSLTELAEQLGVRELLMAPVPVQRGQGAILLAGRGLGPFRSDHVELMRTVVAAAGSALDRQLISSDLDAAQSRGAELERRASHDALTGLANRALFERELEAAVVAGQRCSVLFVDLDGFKGVNDTWGHAAGDAVLKAAAQRLNKRVRGGDLAARIGGDEFAVLVREQGVEEAALIGQRILADFASPVPDAPGVRSIHAAVGAAEVRPGEGAQALLARADQAMYVAKRAGGHRVEQAPA